MQMDKHRFLNAVNVTKMLVDGSNLSIASDDLDFLTQDRPWVVTDRARASGIIRAITNGATDLAGIPALDVPTEFLAAIIHKFVNPTNWMVAASTLGNTVAARDIEDGQTPVTPSVLFAYILRLDANDVAHVEARTSQRSSVAQKNA